MKIPNLPKKVIYILEELSKNKYEGYIVGGCVRDSLMGILPHDWDITTSATPEEVKKIFPHTFDTGIKHGTVTVVIDKENFEITTYRVEGEYEDCRHPSYVAFTRDLHEDLLRRDFTINAIAYNEKDGYIDIFQGIEHIDLKLIKGVGFADDRFKEDALRMLRALRFSVQLNFNIEEETLIALKENVHLIKNISAERIREELTKTFVGDYIEKIPLLWESKLLYYINENFYESLKEKEDIVKYLKKCEKDKIVRYGLLLIQTDKKTAQKFIEFLKFDNKTKKLLETIINNFYNELIITPYNVRKFISKAGLEATIAIAKIKIALGNEEFKEVIEIVKEAVENNYCLTIKDLDITGDQLFELGIEKGKKMGEALNYLLDSVLEKPELNKFHKLKKIICENF